MKKKERFLLIIIILAASILRLYRFANPIGDWHAWRQADTSAVSRNFVKEGYDVFHPKFDDLSNVPSGKNNPEGYRFVEFPVYNVLQAGLYQAIGIFTLEEWGRLVTIFASVLSILFLYFLALKYAGPRTALFTSFFFAFLPFSIYFGRTILPDPSMVAAILGGIYFFDLWIEESVKFKVQNSKSQFKVKHYFLLILAIVFTANALLLKPYAIFFTLPMIYLAYAHFGLGALKKWQLYIFALLAVLPLIIWRLWMVQYPEGIPASDWLFNAGNIRFKGAFFYWLFADRIGRLLLGYWGLALFVIGILANSVNGVVREQKGRWFFYSFLIAALCYMTVIARGNVQHDYYQILIIPCIAIFLGIGSAFLLNPPKGVIHILVARGVLLSCIVFSLLFSWYFVRDYFNINNESFISAGKTADAILPKDAKVIALNNGDTSFLYHTNRKGWASFQNDIPSMVDLGAQYMIIANPTENDYAGFGTEYEIVAADHDVLILKLHK